MRTFLSALLLAALAGPALADSVTGTVVANDRVDHVLVLEDKTIWQVPADFPLPDNLAAGDLITIEFEGGAENGIGPLISITRING